ncbi:hypothetical protein DYD21_16350 [Rhodohalobacter sp. SW132]|uniref:hypothetical protein n=1 Tax=Rhodohalobacter sp. SW132 TaxID=2293433 RepID=UPI000E270B55|nr:hypothetical protein [Rhodohalobacter sp. SW132]REL24738.1 hypothetical protein DYD21_16350 [Rhodohalobacter sp. SW132]
MTSFYKHQTFSQITNPAYSVFRVKTVNQLNNPENLAKMLVKRTFDHIYNGSLSKAVNRKINLYKTKILHSKIGNLAPVPDEIITIDPTKICGHMDVETASSFQFFTGYSSGAVIHYEWDKAKDVEYVNFQNLELFKSCKRRWIHGCSWEETELYQFYVECLNNGIPCRFNTIKELEERYEKLDQIFEEVKSTRKMSDKHSDLVKISVAKDGRLIWGPDGRHRVCIALLAGLESMPARVGFIHFESLDYFQTMRFK